MIIRCDKCSLQYDVRSYQPGTKVKCRCGSLLVVPEHKITTIRCPSCGGTVDASETRCHFCQSLITRKVCPNCAASLRETAKYCDQCGFQLRAVDAAVLEATDHSCPRCSKPLVGQNIGGFQIEVCGECLGMWVMHDVLEQIYSAAPKKLEFANKTVGKKPAVGGVKANVNYIPCPECGKLMNRENYARVSGVIVDVCRDHGVWFDADELNRILEFHARGGKVVDRMAEEKQKARKAASKALASVNETELGNSVFGAAMAGSFWGRLAK